MSRRAPAVSSSVDRNAVVDRQAIAVDSAPQQLVADVNDEWPTEGGDLLHRGNADDVAMRHQERRRAAETDNLGIDGFVRSAVNAAHFADRGRHTDSFDDDARDPVDATAEQRLRTGMHVFQAAFHVEHAHAVSPSRRSAMEASA